jgi:3-oxoacyl-[acyl-carrier protein] reductase
MLNLEGQTALVTGASRGLGYAIALRLAQQGATVHCVATTEAGAQSAANRIAEATGANAFGHAADIGSGESVTALFAAVQAHSPQLEILVNNAGITRDGLLMRMKEEDFDEVMRVNLKSVFLCTKAALKGMMKLRYGRIINLTSIVGVRGQAGQANYAASKAGIIGFTKSTARELSSRGVTCNAVAPGFIESDMTSVLSEEHKAALIKDIPLGRMGKPEEIADLTAFLSSKEAGYITGQVLSIDGGMGI